VTTQITSIEPQTLRRDFPLLQRTMRGKPISYLDSASSTQKPRQVLEALESYYAYSNANVHRGVYELAEEATEAYESARSTVAGFINADIEETIFVRNVTEAINLVAYTWGRSNVRRGDVIVLTRLEHHSNLVPWQILAHEVGAELEFIELLADGSLDLDSLDRHLASGRVRLVASAYISNVLGTIAPVAEIARRAHLAGALVLIDAAQAVPHIPVDVRALDVDFLGFTGHKMLGPMGVGVLYGRRALLEEMPPFLGGGEMIRHVGSRESTWNDLPWKFEAGTPSVGDAVGLAAGIEYLQRIGMDTIQEHDRRLVTLALTRLREVDGLHVVGPEQRGSVIAFTLDGIHPHDVASLLDEQGIAVRAGHHCAQPLHDLLGVPATTRASFYLYNDDSEIDRLAVGIEAAKHTLGA
jgi:cysteine desulfurase / selenocysteine lyase